MPLRISESYESTDVGDICNKRTHKMSRKGHYQKVRRPTNLEVYNDAAQILEELLGKRIDRDLRVNNRQKRNKTDPNTEHVLNTLKEPENPVARSKTMPSKYRESPNAEAKKKELDALLKRDRKLERQYTNGFVSSADTEGEDDEDITLKTRKKKSLFKLAKERLIQTFNRDQKDGLGKVKEKKESPNVKKRKPKRIREKASGDVVSEKSRHIKAHLNGDNSVDYTEEVEYRNKSGSIHTDMHCRNSRSSSFSRNALINTLKKPFQKSDKNIARRESRNQPSNPTSSSNSAPIRPTAFPKEPSSDRSVPGAVSPQSLSSIPSPNGDTHAIGESCPTRTPMELSSSSSVLPPSDHNSLLSLTNVMSSIQSNMLDSPDDDIQFMDVDIEVNQNNDGENRTKSIHASGVKFHTSEGLLNFNWLADQTADKAKALDYEIAERSVSRLRPNGDMETTTTVTAVRTVIMPDVVEEVNEEDQPDGDDEPDRPMNKEELYGKIAQKLIAMADTYGAGVSDTESMGATAASDAPLTDLEKEIISCLRSKDKYSKEMEEKLMEVTASTMDDAYQRFHSTIQNSLGTELSWNQLAFLFYSTKGVVSALGKGSNAANQAKNFTLQYISDTFASWIMDQGGFDSMLSSSESDPEID